MSNLRALAKKEADRLDSSALMPVIEKELLHYEILRVMDDAGYTSILTFQGGTSLRLCYGNQRYSEDLDFAGGTDFKAEDMNELGKILKERIASTYDVEVSVKEPKEKGLVARWRIVINTAVERPDLPSQRIKIEVGKIPAHTSILRNLLCNYEEVPSKYGDTVLAVESIDEIIADKIVAFEDAKMIRYRDIWDLNWMLTQRSPDDVHIRELVRSKCEDYGFDKDADKVIVVALDKMASHASDAEFIAQMSRFLPKQTMESTLNNVRYREALCSNLESFKERMNRAAPEFLTMTERIASAHAASEYSQAQRSTRPHQSKVNEQGR